MNRTRINRIMVLTKNHLIYFLLLFNATSYIPGRIRPYFSGQPGLWGQTRASLKIGTFRSYNSSCKRRLIEHFRTFGFRDVPNHTESMKYRDAPIPWNYKQRTHSPERFFEHFRVGGFGAGAVDMAGRKGRHPLLVAMVTRRSPRRGTRPANIIIIIWY